MSTFKRQTYDNSYLFSLPGELDKHHKKLAEFILKAERIEAKSADNFRGVVEDVKRYQKSSVLYSILMRDDVVIAYSLEAMPNAFKVFSAKDISRGGGNKVFIDVTGLIINKNGNYVCKDIGKFCTYLFQAITWLLYDSNPLALVNNSSITISGTECFVSLFDYLIGYFRFYGYSENRNKILYIAALYFLIRLLGKDDDQYTRNLAAKVSGAAKSNLSAYELYYKPEDFNNINTFITSLASNFKLKGLTTEVFISKWIYICGTGTEYAPELFTAFSNMMIGVYCGAYVVPNQKTIEAQTKSNMVKFATAIMKLGVDEFDNRQYMEATELDKTIPRDKLTEELYETLQLRKQSVDGITCKVFEEAGWSGSLDPITKSLKTAIDHYTATDESIKLRKYLVNGFKAGAKYLKENLDYYNPDSLRTIVDGGRKYLKQEDKDTIKAVSEDTIQFLRDDLEKAKDNKDKNSASLISKAMLELMWCKSNI